MSFTVWRGWMPVALGLTLTVGCSGTEEDAPGEAGKAGAGGTSGVGGGAGTQANGGATSGTANGGTGGDVASGDSGSGDGSTTSGTGGASKGGSSGSSGSSGKGGSSGGSGKGGSSGSSGKGGSSGSSGKGGSSTGSSTAAELAKKLGREPNFMIGMGNDLNNDHNQDGAYTLGVTLDMHYAYLVGLPGEGGWPDWNTDGSFVNILADSADAHGVTPMYTVYGMAAHGEGNVSVLTDPDYMENIRAQQILLFQRLAIFDKPAIVHLEPDFWGFVQQQSGGDPSSIKVLIHGIATDCEDQPEDLAGLGHCIIKLARMYSPKVAVGFHASTWAGSTSDTVAFLNALGADESDFVAIDLLDRDAGCFEAAVNPNCMRGGSFYWDETNQTSPNFHDFLDTSKQVHDGLAKPVIWWQIPFGVPSSTPGGTAGHYRDNRVHYIFSHIDEFVEAGGLGCAFGTGAGNQTDITTDGGQFKDAVTTYLADPTPLP